MGKAYRYVFYRIYRWGLDRHGERDLPHVTALFILTLSIFENLMTVALLVELLGVPVFSDPRLVKVIGALILGALTLVNYRNLIQDRRMCEIVDEFENRSPVENPRAGIWVVAYLVGSVGLFFSLALIGALVRTV